jgi:hypothetical protein
MMREERMLRYFVGFELTGDALFEIDRFRRKAGRKIRPLITGKAEVVARPENRRSQIVTLRVDEQINFFWKVFLCYFKEFRNAMSAWTSDAESF